MPNLQAFLLSHLRPRGETAWDRGTGPGPAEYAGSTSYSEARINLLLPRVTVRHLIAPGTTLRARGRVRLRQLGA